MSAFFKPHIPKQASPRMAQADEFGVEESVPRLPACEHFLQDNVPFIEDGRQKKKA